MQPLPARHYLIIITEVETSLNILLHRINLFSYVLTKQIPVSEIDIRGPNFQFFLIINHILSLFCLSA